MHRFIAITAWFVLAQSVMAQNGSEVDRDAVLRVGNLVQIIDGTHRDNDSTFLEVMGPPADDNHKWFISVVGQRNDSASLKLKQDWQASPDLLALGRINLNEQKESWSHFNWYDASDKSQTWRWERIQVSAYPTVVVQPSRDGNYGDPKTVVYQGVYQGDPKKLANAMRDSIRRYVQKFPPRNNPPVRRANLVGVDPPWSPPPKIDPNIDLSQVFPKPKAPLFVVPPSLDPEPAPVFKLDWAWLWKTAILPILAALLGLWAGKKMGPTVPAEEPTPEVARSKVAVSTAEQLAAVLTAWQEDKQRRLEAAKTQEAEDAKVKEVLLNLTK